MADHSMHMFPNGLDGSGDPLWSYEPFWTSRPVYINSASGTDAVGNGTEPEDAYASLAYAITQEGSAGDGRLYILAEGHEETVTSTITLAKPLTILGNGSGTSRPKLKRNHGSNRIFNVTSHGVHIRSVYIAESIGSVNTNGRIQVGAAGFSMINCYVECGQYDDAGAVVFNGAGADDGFIEGCTFISTVTSLAALPEHGIHVVSGSVGLWVRDTIFDGGAYGFDGDAVYLPACNAVFFEGVTLRRGADIQIAHPSAPGSILHVSSADGAAKIY